MTVGLQPRKQPPGVVHLLAHVLDAMADHLQTGSEASPQTANKAVSRTLPGPGKLVKSCRPCEGLCMPSETCLQLFMQKGHCCGVGRHSQVKTGSAEPSQAMADRSDTHAWHAQMNQARASHCCIG